MIISTADRLAQVSEYYFARKLAELRQREAAGESIINLGIGSPDLPPSDDTIRELINASLEPGVHGYQSYRGLPQLRKALAAWYLSTYGAALDPEQEILPLMGSKEGIMHVSMAFLNPGDQALIPDPGYPTYTSNTRLAGGEPLFYRLSAENGWLPDLDALEQMDLRRVKLMWINYPHMPTGASATPELFGALVRFARRHRILLCHDNPYSLVLNPEPRSLLALPEARGAAIELNSLSKSHNMAGWRIGMAAGDAAYINAILQVKSNMDSGMFLPLQRAAVQALKSSYAWHAERNDEYRLRRETVFGLLRAIGCTFDPGQCGLFVWARIPEDAASGEALSESILNRTGVFITPGFIFGSAGERYVRVSLCASQARLREALERVLRHQIAWSN
ncbi:MAG: aminotransferase class I/II-fold pyridoxal phosphate-dependent enzyme [Bacteroidia bacterium]|nr:aminotransferase class I/II-fold pyridoxal phosphate-dependent enzyme [Bacteroidia bacterium]